MRHRVPLGAAFLDDYAAGDIDRDDPDDPAPYCTACGSEVGIFIRFSLNWKHYRATGKTSVEFFDADHAPEVGWRPGTPTPA